MQEHWAREAEWRLAKKILQVKENFDELETVKISRIPITVITANGEVQTHEEARVYVKELDMFMKVKIFDDTPAVFSLGKLCEDHGYSYEWTNGRTPCLIEKWCSDTLNTEICVPIVFPGFIDDVFLVKLVWNNTSNIVTARKYRLNTNSSKISKPKKVDHEQVREDPSYSDIPEWLQEFRENLVDDRVPEHRDSHASSSHEPYFRAAEKSGIRQTAQYVNSFSETPRLRDLPEE